MNRQTKVVNVFGGAGVGKTTTMTGLFHEMRKRGMLAELISEYAKALATMGDPHRLGDQVYIAAKQNHHLRRIHGHFDYVLCEGPIIASAYYHNPEAYGGYPKDAFEEHLMHLWRCHDNLNFLIIRNPDLPYETEGRYQTHKEAVAMDAGIKANLDRLGIAYHEVMTGENTVSDMLAHLGVQA